MLTFPLRDDADPRRSRTTAAAAAFVAVGLLAVAMLLGRSSTQPSAATPQWNRGTVEIDGRVYPFAPRTCAITDEGFVAAGPGLAGEESFVASVSKSGGLQVAFGVRNDVDRPGPDQLWWVSSGLRQARIEGTSVRATAKVEDRSGTVTGPRTAVINIACPETS